MIGIADAGGPCFAVIFSAELSDDLDGYGEAIERMRELAAQQPGYLGMESTMEDGFEITVSYWRSAADIARWKENPEHRAAQQQGRSRWYRRYTVRVAQVQRQYGSGP